MLIRSDAHVHTNLSFDGRETHNSFIEKGIRLGLEFIGFCEHVDLDRRYTFGYYPPPIEKWDELNELRKKFEGTIDVRFGLEITYLPHLSGEIRECLNGPWDFAVGSVHIIELDDKVYDVSTHEEAAYVFERYPLDRVVHAVADTTESLAASGFFNTIGHIDMLKRYFPKERITDLWEQLGKGELFRPALKTAAEKGLSLEINTSGLRHGHGELYPREEVLAIWRDAGGRTVTYGSDAHCVEELGQGREEAAELVERYGFDLADY